MSSAAFWRLVDRLQIPDPDALELIGYAGDDWAARQAPAVPLSSRQSTWRLRTVFRAHADQVHGRVRRGRDGRGAAVSQPRGAEAVSAIRSGEPSPKA